MAATATMVGELPKAATSAPANAGPQIAAARQLALSRPFPRSHMDRGSNSGSSERAPLAESGRLRPESVTTTSSSQAGSSPSQNRPGTSSVVATPTA